MRRSRLYLDQALAEGEPLTLPAASAHYLQQVLRLKQHAPITLFNGNGMEYHGTISSLQRREVVVSIDSVEAVNRESPLHSHLGIAISKGDRMDWVMQKTTELGVSEITPLWSERTEVKLKAERLEKKLQHWQKIIIAACEQSGRNTLPVLRPPQALSDWLGEDKPGLKLILHPGDNQASLTDENPAQVNLLIGPEGGFSDDEVHQALQNNFRHWVLGPRILRTETAPVVALAALQLQFGDYAQD